MLNNKHHFDLKQFMITLQTSNTDGPMIMHPWYTHVFPQSYIKWCSIGEPYLLKCTPNSAVDIRCLIFTKYISRQICTFGKTSIWFKWDCCPTVSRQQSVWTTFLERNLCETLTSHGQILLTTYARMANTQFRIGKPGGFPPYPKLHMFHECVLTLKRDGQRTGRAFNPVVFSCQVDEDRRKTSRLSCGVSTSGYVAHIRAMAHSGTAYVKCRTFANRRMRWKKLNHRRWGDLWEGSLEGLCFAFPSFFWWWVQS